MKILVAFDSFKESFSAYDAGLAIQSITDHEVIIKPMADGGEGTMEAMNASLNGSIHEITVTGPYHTPTQALISIHDDLAIIECAQACGLDKVKEEDKHGEKATTLGVGEMIEYAYTKGARTFLLTLGGSATNDGGAGLLSKCGYTFYNGDKVFIPVGETLKDITDIKYTPRFEDASFIGACDVKNPLCGTSGATYIYGPQKGVKDAETIDQGMKYYAKRMAELLQDNQSTVPGTGAAGGLGFAIRAGLHGELKSGFDIVKEMTSLEESIKECDIVFTGEGKMDHQTLEGKTPYGVLQTAKKYQKKVIAFTGKLEDADLLKEAGFEDVRCINHVDEPLEVLLKKGLENLKNEVKDYLCQE